MRLSSIIKYCDVEKKFNFDRVKRFLNKFSFMFTYKQFQFKRFYIYFSILIGELIISFPFFFALTQGRPKTTLMK